VRGWWRGAAEHAGKRSAVEKFITLRGPRALNAHEGLVFITPFKNKATEVLLLYIALIACYPRTGSQIPGD
jgi:hypothetical protein